MLNRHMEPRSFPLTIRLPEPMTSSGKVIMYYVTSAGEMVADSIILKAEPCLQNQVRGVSSMRHYDQNTFHHQWPFGEAKSIWNKW